MLITGIASSRRLGGPAGADPADRISTARSQGFGEAAVPVVKNLWGFAGACANYFFDEFVISPRPSALLRTLLTCADGQHIGPEPVQLPAADTGDARRARPRRPGTASAIAISVLSVKTQ